MAALEGASEAGPISVPAAIVIGLISSFVQSLGLTIQRKSHIQNAHLPVSQQRGEWHRPSWVIGFVIFLVANIGGTVFQIGALPIVMLAPLGAVSLLYNALLARFLLDDFFSKFMVVGTTLIAIGAVLIGYFGVVQEPNHSLDDLLALYARPTFVIFASLFMLVFIGALAVAHLAEWQLHLRLFRPLNGDAHANKHKKKKRKSMQRRWSAPSLAPVVEVSESTSGIATPILAIADEAARRGIPVERVLVQRGPGGISPHRRPAQPVGRQTASYGATSNLASPTRARGSSASSSSSAYSLPNLDDVERQSTSAAALNAAEHDPAVRRTCLALAVAYGGASGTLSGACLLLAKSGVELLVLTIAGDNQFDRWQSWFLVVVMLLAALLQLWYLNKSLRLASPPLVCPLAFCFYNTSSIALGLVYFDQLGALSVTSIALVVVGIVVLLAGVWIVSLHGPEVEVKTEESDDGAREVGERQPLLSDVRETVASPTTSSPLSSSVGAAQQVALDNTAAAATEGLLANAAGIGGPHLPNQQAKVVVVSSSPEVVSPERGSLSPTSKSRRHSRGRSRAGSGSGGGMGGLGLHMPGLPQHPRLEHDEDEEPDVTTQNNARDESSSPAASDGPGQGKALLPKLRVGSTGSVVATTSPHSALLSPPPRGSRRRGLYEALLERGLSIGISPSSPGFHVGSTFELEPGTEEDEERGPKWLWRRRRMTRRTFSENDTSMATERRRRQERHAEIDGDGDAAEETEAARNDALSDTEDDDVRFPDTANANSSAWSRVIPTLDMQALNDRLRRIKADAGGWIGF